MGKATISDVAKKAGVSAMTVSNVFNRRNGEVSPETSEKVIKAAEKLNYKPASMTRKKCIAIVVESAIGGGAYENMLISHISSILLREEILIQIFPVNDLEMLNENIFSGVITMVHKDSSYEKIKKLKDKVPLVCINHPEKGFNTVFSDESTGLPEAIRYLSEKGHRKIGLLLVKANQRSLTLRKRLDAYHNALLKYGLENEDQLVQYCFNHGLGPVETISKLLKAKPTAIIAGGENLHHHILYGLYFLDKKVPEELSIISFEDENSWLMTPPHTTIGQNYRKIAETAIARLLNLQNGNLKKGNNIIWEPIPYAFTERESVADISNNKRGTNK